MLKRNGVDDERTPRHRRHVSCTLTTLFHRFRTLPLPLPLPLAVLARVRVIVVHTPTVCHARLGALRLCLCIAPGTPARTLPTHSAWANNAPACHSPMPALAHLGPPRTTLRHPSIHDSSVSASVSLRYNGRRTAAYLATHSIYPFPLVRPSQRPHPPKCAARSWAPSFPPYSAVDLICLEPQPQSANFHSSLCHHLAPGRAASHPHVSLGRLLGTCMNVTALPRPCLPRNTSIPVVAAHRVLHKSPCRFFRHAERPSGCCQNHNRRLFSVSIQINALLDMPCPAPRTNRILFARLACACPMPSSRPPPFAKRVETANGNFHAASEVTPLPSGAVTPPSTINPIHMCARSKTPILFNLPKTQSRSDFIYKVLASAYLRLYAHVLTHTYYTHRWRSHGPHSHRPLAE
ncbi:hypothetical protein COCMIDRAFT_23464 [Bipolaris oryzae ATCC 44560]|uniref:Uncharacterized protein n=1 Tax=Bipolaris oryzae ATCC 44560 TaxID=930090 RepID=W6ZAW0_COCMI|nr:uncharacterized protein COCMIDRAFT_23464 [Bipolaris oryzae ATCC 44560]EUC48902.1 hypothetical protein COCMIDRAFT_23464 [Bipolaris oryzae ATCC 44560]